MKILSVHFKNINSLYGEWFIDFTAPQYVANPIFIITGPTGSGKTTILDAITVALFQKTPRQDKIKKSVNNLMSKGTAVCFSEVKFEVDGIKYTASFKQERARLKSDGNLKDFEHDFKGGKYNTTKKHDESLKAIQEVIHMDYNRFTKTILLAQSSFGDFLESNSDDKASILEKLTNTSIYSDISVQVFQEYREAKDKVARIEQEIDNIYILSTEEEVELRSQIQEINNEIKELRNNIEYIETKEIYDDKNKELMLLNEELITLKKDSEIAIKNFNDFDKIYNNQINLFNNVRNLDSSITEERNLINSLVSHRKLEESKCSRNEKTLKEYYDLKTKLEEIKSNLEKNVLDNNIKDTLKNIAAYKNQVNSYLKISIDYNEKEKCAKTIEINDINIKELDLENKNYDKIIKDNTVKISILSEENKTLNINELKDKLNDKLTIKKQCELTLNLVKELEDGKPCRICGSTIHPKKAETNATYYNVLEEIKEIEPKILQYEENIEIINSLNLGNQNNFRSIETNKIKIDSSKTNIKMAIQTIDRINLAEVEKRELAYELEPLMKVLGIEINDNSINKILEHENNLSEIINELNNTINEINVNNVNIVNIEKAIKENKLNIESYIKSIDDHYEVLNRSESKRKELFDDKDVNMEQNIITKKYNNLLEDKAFKESIFINKEKYHSDLYILVNSLRENLQKLKAYDGDKILENLKKEMEENLTTLGSKSSELKRNESDQERVIKISKNLDDLRLNSNKWERLYKLIGSSDGDKYKRKVQGITFSILLHKANIELAKITKRYKLILTDISSLDLSLIDNDQQGISRPISTLSGGEKFIVSLALALGLSKMSSRNVEINSLFLDEGFGTLDYNTLEDAIKAIESLRNEGKLIGIISHVESVKQRISTQIEIIPEGNGKSRIKGPGVSLRE